MSALSSVVASERRRMRSVVESDPVLKSILERAVLQRKSEKSKQKGTKDFALHKNCEECPTLIKNTTPVG